jgi:ABC-type uncharacterized transport system ATPase component
VELIISNLRKIYSSMDNEPSFTLSVPSLSLRLPSIVCLMGHNGSGKSVLLRLLAGEERPSYGRTELTLDGQRWAAELTPSPIVRQNVDLSLALDLSVRENLVLHLQLENLRDYIRPVVRFGTRVQTILEERHELLKKLDQPCRYLSGGQKQALSFLAVSSRKFPLLLLDEFLGAADQATTALLLRLLSRYVASTPACALMVTHNISLALDHSQRILVLRSGKLVKDICAGAPEWEDAFIRDLLASS